MDENKSPNQSPLAGVALVLLALGVFVFSDDPFKPTRPEAPPELTSTAEDVRARLWQDPFEAVELHRTEKHTDKKPEKPEKSEKLNWLRSKQSNYSMYQDKDHLICMLARMNTLKFFGPVKQLKKEKIQLENELKSASSKNESVENIIKEIKEVDNKIEKLKYDFDPANQSAHTLNELRCRILRDAKIDYAVDTDLHVIAVMVPDAPYAEERETRIRTRYAVISGLSEAGYIPKDPEHIGYMDFSGKCNQYLNKKELSSPYGQEAIYCDFPATVPYEWFVIDPFQKDRKDGKDKKIFSKNLLVIWLHDEAFAKGKPLDMLNNLRDKLTRGLYDERFVINRDFDDDEVSELDARIKFDVIGPSGSTTLVKMHIEAHTICFDNNKCIGQLAAKKDLLKKIKASNKDEVIRIFSARATIQNSAIKSLSKKAGSNDVEVYDADQARWMYVEHSEPKSTSLFNLIRTIPTDKILVEGLLLELQRRGVNPYRNNSLSDSDEEDTGNHSGGFYAYIDEYFNGFFSDYIAEHDSQDHIVLIGEWDTVYSRNLNNLFSELMGGTKDSDPPWLHSYNYYRGIDGSTANKLNTTIDEDKDDAKGKEKTLRRPVDENQFDYLRRLGDRITDLSETLKGEGSIRAIGVVGSDAYDKLLVLQALRARFPNVIFFTTDLDARMLHAGESEWTRNLVVASGYGLRPPINQSHQGLPFRDGYQTSVFMATLQATDKGKAFDNNHKLAKIYEIGNREAIDYTRTTDTESGEVDGEIQKFYNDYGSYFFIFILLFVLLAYQTSNKTRKYIISTALVFLVVVFWICSLTPSNSIEFKFMLSGTSIWPTLIIRMVAAVLSVMFIFFALGSLQNNTNNIIEKYLGQHKLPVNRGGLWERVRGRYGSLSGERYRNVKMAGMIVRQVICSIKAYNRRSKYEIKPIDNKAFEKLGRFPHLCVTSWGSQYEKYEKNKPVSINELMHQYVELGRASWWFARVGIMLLLYLGMICILIGLPSTKFLIPYSGYVSAHAYYSVLIIGVLAYLILVFLVVDVTRLDSRFVELLTQCNIVWPQGTISKCCDDYNVSADIAIELLKLKIIVERSKAVDVLIFLPFIVLSLSIVSRSSFFDRWSMPLELAVFIVLTAMTALSSAIRLRRSAKNAQIVALENLQEKYQRRLNEEGKSKISNNPRVDPCSNRMSERIKDIMGRIRNISAGPFKPLAQHPIVTSLAMPFGGVGGLYLIDYFANF